MNLYLTMSQTRDQANSATLPIQTAIQTAQDTIFIANVDAQITEKIAQGAFQISATTFNGVNLQTVFQYYVNLGYAVSFPDYPANLNYQPVDLFGQYWEAYWLHRLSLYPIQNPARIIIQWR